MTNASVQSHNSLGDRHATDEDFNRMLSSNTEVNRANTGANLGSDIRLGSNSTNHQN